MEISRGNIAHACTALLLAIFCGGCLPPETAGPSEPEGSGAGADTWPQDAIRVEETDLATVFSDGWVHGNTAYEWSGGTAAHTRTPKASMSFSFTGTRIRWIGWRESTSGIARVWLDGELAGEVDLYTNALEVQAPVFTSEVLEQGPHTLTIEATGSSNPASTGIKVVVDAFEIADGVAPPTVIRLEETARTLSFVGEWHDETACPACSGGENTYARGPDALAQLGFNGTRIRWLGWRKELGGIAKVYLDGAFAAEVDLYSKTPTAQAPIFTSEILDNGPHTLLIEIAGAANPASGDSIVSIDAFDVAIVETVPTVYTVTDLGTLGGAASSAKDINNRGDIVGWANLTDGRRRAYLYRDDVMTDLGTHIGGSFSEAFAINDHGQVVGFSGINEHGPQFREFMNGFVWQAGTMEVLNPLYCFCSFNNRYGTNAVYGINNSGHAAGWSVTRGEGSGDGEHAALWGSGTGRSIGVFPGPGEDLRVWEISRAFGINDAGQLVGDYTPEGLFLGIHERRAFVWRNEIRQDLGGLPGHVSSTALDINQAGAIVGWSGSVDAQVSRAVLWWQGSMQDLGTLHGATNSQALDINASGQIVGWSGAGITIEASPRAPGSSEISSPTTARAFLWQNGQMLDLNAFSIFDENGGPVFGWEFAEATAINDAGQIVGTAFHNGEMRGFLLNPVP